MATDHRGQDHRFPLDGSERAPSEYLHHPGWWTIVDRRGEGLVRGSNDDWDSAEIEDLTEKAGIAWRYMDEPLPELRPDGVLLQQAVVDRWAIPIVGGASTAALAAAYLLPVWLAATYFAVVLGLALYAWQAGALAPPRRSKSTPEIEKRFAEIEKKRLDQDGPSWEPPVRGRWRLALEWQFGTFFVTAIVLVSKGEFGSAAVLPVVSALFFFYTRYVFPGIWWNWWAWVVIGNVGGLLFLVAELSQT
ncbi:MAG TPA: hypothetical protein VEG38_06220 [Acidimicrobiia bacterium]|nr:hypothetical protein [Acidimicrobiia bacterium]